ncbi:MAG: IS1634 family transposase [Candidatus Methanoplasma sp.]|jgi:transposase|nr:IS1634 family transposase [Candidatus Methanoplasma sp.]
MTKWMKADVYEGSPASSMIAMAVMEQSGIRRLIDSLVEYDDQRRLSPGMAVKAMIAPIFDSRKKMPLTGIRHFHNGAPLDLLFGKDVTIESLNDNALARNLDDLFDTGLEDMFWKCSKMIKQKFGFDSKIRHMDSTNYSVWAVTPEYWTDGALPGFSGHAKDGRNDLLQYSAATITDGDRILEYCKAYPGNASDTFMNKDTLEFLKDCLDPTENTVIADCKLVNSDLITTLQQMGMGFISKLPSSFSDKVRDDIIRSVLASETDASSIEGYSTYDTKAETECGELRFIAYRSPTGTGKAMDYLERQGKRDAEKLFKPFVKKTFACETDALSAFDDAVKEHRGSAYAVTGKAVRITETERRRTRGRPPKDSEAPGTKVSWKIDVTMSFDKKRALELADVRNISVIVTNLPFSSEDRGNVRLGATADTVLRLYLDQYKVEHTYRLMKSGMGVDSVYVRTPSRANALLFIVAIATLVSSVIDAVLRQNGKGRRMTVKQYCDGIQNAILEYHRRENAVSVLGPAGSEDKVIAYMDAIGMDPSLLLETFDG